MREYREIAQENDPWNSVVPDQLASEEANWSGSALYAIKYANL